VNALDNRATPELSGPDIGKAGPVQGGQYAAKSSRWRKHLWPEIDGIEAAEDALQWASLMAIPFAMSSLSSPILAGFWGALAWGIHRASRVAACAGLGLFWGSLLFPWPTMSGTTTWVKALLALPYTVAFANGIRGAFAVHQYRAGTGSDGRTSI